MWGEAMFEKGISYKICILIKSINSNLGNQYILCPNFVVLVRGHIRSSWPKNINTWKQSKICIGRRIFEKKE